MADLLTTRQLNRTMLARQHLLDRSAGSATDMLGHLVGMQAQIPNSPYVGLWSRLEGFHPPHLADLLTDRHAVRIALMRGTIHLVTDEDCLVLRPVVNKMLEKQLARNDFGRNLSGIDMDGVVAAGRDLVARRPMTSAELGRLLAERWPDRDPLSLAMAVRNHAPLVQVPPRGVWGKGGLARVTTAEDWLGRDLATSDDPGQMLLRYLRAFGPATVADMQTWSGLNTLRPVVDRLGGQLREFRDERGRELVDFVGAPIADDGVAAPVRFLPEYDNVLVAYADRTRLISDEHRSRVVANLGTPTIVIDGYIAGGWKIATAKGQVILAVGTFEERSATEVAEIFDEGARLLQFVAPDAQHDIRVTVEGE